MSTIPVIYVAGPYRNPTREGVENNIQSARAVGLYCCRMGWSPLIPHSNTGHLDALDPDIGDEFWLASTMELMRRCDAIVLCKGWSQSSGTRAEVAEANRLGLPIFISEYGLPTAEKFLASRGAKATNDNIPATASRTAG